jgi:DNA-directed RNA polymerase subunit RPC12/RpoP
MAQKIKCVQCGKKIKEPYVADTTLYTGLYCKKCIKRVEKGWI